MGQLNLVAIILDEESNNIPYDDGVECQVWDPPPLSHKLKVPKYYIHLPNNTLLNGESIEEVKAVVIDFYKDLIKRQEWNECKGILRTLLSPTNFPENLSIEDLSEIAREFHHDYGIVRHMSQYGILRKVCKPELIKTGTLDDLRVHFYLLTQKQTEVVGK